MLDDAHRYGHKNIVSWLPHGKAFVIHDRPYFVANILPLYFRAKLSSFRQLLRSFGFLQMGGKGWDESAYYHKLFLRDQPDRTRGVSQEDMRKAMPEWIPPHEEPNFYESWVDEEPQNPAAVLAARIMSSLVKKEDPSSASGALRSSSSTDHQDDAPTVSRNELQPPSTHETTPQQCHIREPELEGTGNSPPVAKRCKTDPNQDPSKVAAQKVEVKVIPNLSSTVRRTSRCPEMMTKSDRQLTFLEYMYQSKKTSSS